MVNSSSRVKAAFNLSSFWAWSTLIWLNFYIEVSKRPTSSNAYTTLELYLTMKQINEFIGYPCTGSEGAQIFVSRTLTRLASSELRTELPCEWPSALVMCGLSLHHGWLCHSRESSLSGVRGVFMITTVTRDSESGWSEVTTVESTMEPPSIEFQPNTNKHSVIFSRSWRRLVRMCYNNSKRRAQLFVCSHPLSRTGLRFWVFDFYSSAKQWRVWQLLWKECPRYDLVPPIVLL